MDRIGTTSTKTLACGCVRNIQYFKDPDSRVGYETNLVHGDRHRSNSFPHEDDARRDRRKKLNELYKRQESLQSFDMIPGDSVPHENPFMVVIHYQKDCGCLKIRETDEDPEFDGYDTDRTETTYQHCATHVEELCRITEEIKSLQD